MNKYQPIVKRNFERGYTLIELLIVVTLIGIISSVAYSAFTGYTSEADRSKAQADLYEMAQIMERAFTDNQAYAAADLDLDFYEDRNPRYDFSVAITGGGAGYAITADAETESRDIYDLQINQRGAELFRLKDDTTWSDGGVGWDSL